MNKYHAIPDTSDRGCKPRHVVEICECGPNGGIHRVVARTPAIVGDGAEARARVKQAMREANLMAAALNEESQLVTKFVEFEADHNPQRWRVAGVGRRGGETCTDVGVIRFKPPGRGYAAIVRFSDDKIEIIDPMDILPCIGEESA